VRQSGAKRGKARHSHVVRLVSFGFFSSLVNTNVQRSNCFEGSDLHSKVPGRPDVIGGNPFGDLDLVRHLRLQSLHLISAAPIP
jgi:hypothetical protein